MAGLALKFRWRGWYAARYGVSEAEARAVYPNLVISTLYQAACAWVWEDVKVSGIWYLYHITLNINNKALRRLGFTSCRHKSQRSD